MLKSAAICVLLSVFVGVYGKNSYTIFSNLNSVRVSHNRTHLSVVSDDQKYNNCTLEIGNDLITGSIKAALLGQDKIIVWAHHNWDKDHNRGEDPATERYLYKYTLLLVDHSSCTFKSVPLPDDHENFQSRHHFLPEVVTYDSENYFDFFFSTLKVCAPCRITKNGNRIKLEHQVDPTIAVKRHNPQYNREVERPSQPFYIKAVNGKSFGVDQGYVFVYSSDEYHTATIRLLDRDFKVIRERTIQDAEVYGVSHEKNSADKIGVCLTKRHKEEFFGTISLRVEYNCTLLDSELKQIYSNILPMPANHTSAEATVIVNQGNLHAAALWTPVYSPYEPSFTLGICTYDSTGKLKESAFVPNSDFKLENYSDELRSFIINHESCHLFNNDRSAVAKLSC